MRHSLGPILALAITISFAAAAMAGPPSAADLERYAALKASTAPELLGGPNCPVSSLAATLFTGSELRGGAPPNDTCANAIFVPGNSSVTGTTVGATLADAPPTCMTALNSAPGVWYRVVGDGGPMSVDTCTGTGYDSKIGVFSGTCGSLTCVGGNDDFCGLQSRVNWNSVAGTDYYVYVTGFGPATGNFTLTVTGGGTGGGSPNIVVSPLTLSATQAPNTTTSQTLTIGNDGAAPLTWSIAEEPVSLPVVLTLDGESPESVTTVPLTLSVDDGNGENSVGLSVGGQFVWLNRFTPNPAAYPITLSRVEVMFGYGTATGGVNVGERVDVYVYEDADGNPANGATHRESLTGQAVQAVDGTTWSVFNFGSPVTLNGPGDILIAVVNRTAGVAAGTFPAVIDQTPPSRLRSWAGFGVTPGNPPVLPLPTFNLIDSFGLPGNWLVRGFGTGQPIPCDNPANVPWLSVSPASGTTAASATTNVSVGFDSSSLAPGTYQARLCITSNDPTPGPGNGTGLVVVPVTLNVVNPNVPPVFGYTPPPGSSVTATGGSGIIGSTSNLSIAVAVQTPGTGTGAPATTTLTCTAPTAPFSGFGQTVTAVGSGAISGGPLTGTCTRGATAVTQTLTCIENQGGENVTRTWTLTCPAGSPPPVAVNATSVWSLVALMLALLGFAAVAARRPG